MGFLFFLLRKQAQAPSCCEAQAHLGGGSMASCLHGHPESLCRPMLSTQPALWPHTLTYGPTFWPLPWTSRQSRASVSRWPLLTSLCWRWGKTEGPLSPAGPRRCSAHSGKSQDKPSYPELRSGQQAEPSVPQTCTVDQSTTSLLWAVTSGGSSR